MSWASRLLGRRAGRYRRGRIRPAVTATSPADELQRRQRIAESGNVAALRADTVAQRDFVTDGSIASEFEPRVKRHAHKKNRAGYRLTAAADYSQQARESGAGASAYHDSLPEDVRETLCSPTHPQPSLRAGKRAARLAELGGGLLIATSIGLDFDIGKPIELVESIGVALIIGLSFLYGGEWLGRLFKCRKIGRWAETHQPGLLAREPELQRSLADWVSAVFVASVLVAMAGAAVSVRMIYQQLIATTSGVEVDENAALVAGLLSIGGLLTGFVIAYLECNPLTERFTTHARARDRANAFKRWHLVWAFRNLGVVDAIAERFELRRTGVEHRLDGVVASGEAEALLLSRAEAGEAATASGGATAEARPFGVRLLHATSGTMTLKSTTADGTEITVDVEVARGDASAVSSGPRRVPPDGLGRRRQPSRGSPRVVRAAPTAPANGEGVIAP